MVDIYRPDVWHDFFLMVGGGAAALTGLVFVAMSLNIGVIARDETHLHRSIGTLTSFGGAFVISALALMGYQDHVILGCEWLVVAAGTTLVYVSGYLHAIRRGGSRVGLGNLRLAFGTGLHVVQVVGAGLFALGYLAGLYVAALTMVVLLGFMISGAWLLIVGVERAKPLPQADS